MSARPPQVGDTITTAEELDALPIGAVILCNGVSLARQRSHVVRWAYMVGVGGGYSHTADLLVLTHPNPILVAYLPGQAPRPERVVKAEALREYADAIYRDLARTNSSSTGYPLVLSAVSALRDRADRIERGDT